MNTSPRNVGGAAFRPPRWADQLLEAFLSPHLLEDVQGDLHEVFYKRINEVGPTKARREYGWAALQYVRPYFFKSFRHSTSKSTDYVQLPSFHPAMIRNYLTVAQRNLIRNKSYTTLNVFGLALSMACGILIFMMVSYHLSFDRFHANADRIYRIVTGTGAADALSSAGVYVPMGRVFRDEYTFAEKVGRVATNYGVTMSIPGTKSTNKFREAIAFAEPEFLEIMSFPFAQGRPTVLAEPDRVVITEAIGKKLFGEQNPIGKTIRLDNRMDVTVTGVLKNIPDNTDRKEQIYVSFANLKPFNDWFNEENWTGISGTMQSFVLLKPTVPVAEVEKAFTAISQKHIKDATERKNVFRLQPIDDIHFNLNYDGRMDKTNLWALSLIGLLLIVTACVNFVNLATAQALKRAKEIGIRKVLGSERAQLFWQFIAETGIIAVFAMLVAVVIAYLLMPVLNQLFQIDLAITINYQLVGFLIALTILVTLLSGSYPGLILAGFQPILALKGKLSQKHVGGFSIRRVLVVGQLAISQILIIGTIVITSQMRFSQQSNLGFNKNSVVMLPMPVQEAAKMSTLKSQFMQLPGVEDVSFCMQAPASQAANMTSVRFDNRDKDEDFLIYTKDADEAYMSTFDLKLIAGRNILHSDTTREFVINETAVKALGVKSPQEALGKMLITSKGRRKGPIVGVMKDFFNNSFRGAINPICLRANIGEYGNCAVKINLQTRRETLTSLEKIWNASFPEFIYGYQFVDDQVAQFYALDELILKLIQVFAIIAIIISCLGLFGMISFMAAQKTKEIGIRKALGAGVESIVWLFSKEFIQLTGIAVLVATPIAWWAMHRWLQDFVYKVGIEWWMFALSSIVAIGIVLLTVSYQSVKAALMNPVKSLRSE